MCGIVGESLIGDDLTEMAVSWMEKCFFGHFSRWVHKITSKRKEYKKATTYKGDFTFSPEAPVSTNVEKTGRECLVCAGQHSIIAPMGRQNIGTDSGSGKDS